MYSIQCILYIVYIYKYSYSINLSIKYKYYYGKYNQLMCIHRNIQSRVNHYPKNINTPPTTYANPRTTIIGNALYFHLIDEK